MLGKIIGQYRTFRPSVATKNLCYNFLTRERRRTFGDKNSNQVFYVIRGVDRNSCLYIGVSLHLFANYFYVMSHLKYALDNHWTPVVDQLNYPVYNSICGNVGGVENPWEYYWKQPAGYGLEDVYKSRNVVLSKQSWFSQWDMGYDAKKYRNPEIISFYHGLTEHAPLVKHISEHIDAVRRSLFNVGDRILGVSVRYGGHAKNCYYHGPGHPIAPDTENLIELVRLRLRQWNMDYVFLASDEETSVEKFKEAFGMNLKVLPRRRLDQRRTYNVSKPADMYEADKMYETTLSYLTEMELLSACTGLIGSVTSGLRYAVVRNNNKYEHSEILDCGRFPDVNKRKS